MLVRIEPQPHTLVAQRVGGVGIRRCLGVSFIFITKRNCQNIACTILINQIQRQHGLHVSLFVRTQGVEVWLVLLLLLP